LTILVLGDAILDEFCVGDVKGLSPEAPVVILRNPVSSSHLGGALNTARNIATLGGNVAVVSIVGDDPAGCRLTELVENEFTSSLLGTISNYKTPYKIRYSSNSHSFLRIDYEEPRLTTLDEQFESKALALVSKSEIVVVSDYDKGLVSNELAVKLATTPEPRFKIVDTKKTNLSLFQGVDLITPNLIEGRIATGLEDPADIAKEIQRLTKAAVLLTLGAKGMLLLDKSGNSYVVEAMARDVSDVTGAGDSVVAGISVALSEGAPLLDAVTWSAKVASIAVIHSGTYAVSRIEAGHWKR
jgi:D-beta-D-heptose 7-phosphate kinase/D-beta-D-heptose 1-phosphate adenosyltransferase